MERVKENLFSRVEVVVLQTLAKSSSFCETSSTDVSEISVSTGIRDNDEVLRALYTLEGKNLVCPEPAGDFTSHLWKITATGEKALQLMDHN